MNSLSLAGRKLLVTGAAGGVDRAVSRRLLAEGAKLLLTDRDQAPLESLAEELRKPSLLATPQRISPGVDCVTLRIEPMDQEIF